MLNNPLMQYHLIKAEQSERLRKAEQARITREAISNSPGPVEQGETAPDLTGLVERVIQNVWKRLGLPAREGGAPPLPAPSGGLPLLPE